MFNRLNLTLLIIFTLFVIVSTSFAQTPELIYYTSSISDLPDNITNNGEQPLNKSKFYDLGLKAANKDFNKMTMYLSTIGIVVGSGALSWLLLRETSDHWSEYSFDEKYQIRKALAIGGVGFSISTGCLSLFRKNTLNSTIKIPTNQTESFSELELQEFQRGYSDQISELRREMINGGCLVGNMLLIVGYTFFALLMFSP